MGFDKEGRPDSRSSKLSDRSDRSFDMLSTARTNMQEDVPEPNRRTLRRMFEDKSEYKNDYEYLYGLEPAPSYWQPEAGTKYTLFHKGFYRREVKGQDTERIEFMTQKAERSEARASPRREALSERTKHHFLREEPATKSEGRKHFMQACNVIIAGPESIVPKGPDMQRPRMQTLLREGLQAERKETVKDLFSHMFGYTVNDVKTSAAD